MTTIFKKIIAMFAVILQLLIGVCQMFFCVVGGDCAVGDSGDDLPQRFGSYITYGKYTGNACPGGFVCRNVAAFVQGKLTVY